MGCTWLSPPIDSAFLLPFFISILLSEFVGLVLSHNQRFISLEMGDEVVLLCRVPRDNIPVEWTKLPQRNLLQQDKRVSITRKANISRLHLRNVSWTDAAIYQCNRRDSGQNLVEIRLTVTCNIKSRTNLSSYSSISEVAVNEGENVQLNCNTSKESNVVWWIKNKHNEEIFFRGQTLNICNVQTEDAGVYVCAEQQEELKPINQAHLVVQYAPAIRAPWLHVLQAVNYSSELQCIINAFPVAQVAWFKENTLINDTSRYRVTTEANHHVTETTLTVVNTDHNDYGNYTCHATNEIGFAALTLKLAHSHLPIRRRKSADVKQDVQAKPTFTGFVLGMLPPLCISFYIILHLGFRSRYAEERPEEEGGDGLDEILGEQAFKMSS